MHENELDRLQENDEMTQLSVDAKLRVSQRKAETQNAVGVQKADNQMLSRRGFLQAAGLLGVAAVGIGATACSMGGASGAASASGVGGQGNDAKSWLPDTWDYQADVVVVGHGGAGISAAITIVSENLGNVLVIEAAPEEFEGGNTKVSGNLLFIPEKEDEAITYQTALNDMNTVEAELLKGWARNICENKTWLEDLGIKLTSMPSYAPEFPELPGSEAVKTYTAGGKMGYHSLWAALKEVSDDLGGYQILYDTRGLKLIRNPLTNEALGIIAEQGNKQIAIKAAKGIILSCGGFENNPEMLRNYLGIGQSKVCYGTPYNRGDGFAMVSPFGAQLWHMNNAAGATNASFGAGFDAEVVTSSSFGYSKLPLHSYIFVGVDGRRYMYEETNLSTRHGKILAGGVYVDQPTPEGAWCVFDQMIFDNINIAPKVESLIGWASAYDLLKAQDNEGFLSSGIIVKGDTIEDLASKMGVSAKTLKETVETYNGYAATGVDIDFKRGQVVYDRFAGNGDNTQVSQDDDKLVEAVPAFQLTTLVGPFYATRLGGCIYNTQGGPKRNGDGQILNASNEVIPRLYGAGEFGAIYSYMYNGGGNVSDAVGSGRAAARHAAGLSPWDMQQ
ncbi:MAG: FAD-binding protein [Coriobacteriales bacterium]|jgi:succinate dehydrogenase/fumarate reductase flavoprotein subunit|nr:FAD-binding protein [Coriobacteriales bacterium]